MMKKLGIALLALMLVLSLTGAAMAEDDRTLTVEGNATVTIVADIATLSIGVETRNEKVAEAQSENAAQIAAVIAALKEAGVDEKDIITENFSVYSYREGDYNAEQKTVNVVNNMLSVTIRDLNKAGALIDTAMQAGANSLGGLNFDSSARNEAYKQALSNAVSDAKGKADVLAAAAGVQLGKLNSVVQNGGYGYAAASNYVKAAGSAAKFDTSIIGGDITVSATVTLVYGME